MGKSNNLHLCHRIEVIDFSCLFSRADDRRQKIRIAKTFLRGFTIDNEGKCGLTAKRVATLTSSHFAHTTPRPSNELKFNFTYSANMFELMKHGVNDGSLSLDQNAYADRVKADVYDIGHNEYSAWNSTITLYSVFSSLHKKTRISFDSHHLRLDWSFYGWIINAISDGLIHVQSAKNLVKVLNEYGWYLPTEYVLGGAKLRIQNETVKMNEAINDFTNTFQSVAYLRNASSSYELQATTEQSQSETESVEYNNEWRYEYISGVHANGNVNETSFIQSLNDDPNKWDIIEYVKFVPTLNILNKQNPFLFKHCLKLLKEFHSHNQIKSLQKSINIQEYATKLEFETSKSN